MMITNIEDYFSKGCGRCSRFDTADCSTKKWAAGLDALRSICIELDLEETVKWGHPCYVHAGRNIAIIGAHRGDFRLSFFNAALMTDPENVLIRRGPNTQHPDMFLFDNVDDVLARAPIIRKYLSEAMGYAAEGKRAPTVTAAVELPEELTDALDADPELSEAFHALTPGRQRSYAINLNSAKKSETRVARIWKFRDKILAGKGALER